MNPNNLNLNLIMQLLKSKNPQQMILNMMNPQQRQIAQAFLSNPNREQALEKLKKDYNVSDEQINSLKNALVK